MAGRHIAAGLRELSGALGDLGTLLPLMLGAIALAGLAPVPVVLGFALAYLATAAIYRLPIPVQPMKAVAAVLLTTEMSPAAVAASGVMLGLVLAVLGLTGWIDRLGRLVPQSVLAGLQLGLGLALGAVAVGLIAAEPVVGLGVLAVLLLAMRMPGWPAALLAVGAAVLLGRLAGAETAALAPIAWEMPGLVALPSLAEIERAAAELALPQIALTLTNAVILTALVAGDCHGARARHVTPRRLALTSGLGNLALAPFGALPMCHGAGGVVAHHRFGARSGLAPALIGGLLLALALVPGGHGIAALGLVPQAGLGALLLVAAWELAISRRLFDCRPSCWPVIAATAAATLLADPFWGLAAGTLAEILRVAVVRRLYGRRTG